MPERLFDLTTLRALALSGEEIVVSRSGLRLRPRDPATGRYAPDGRFVAGEATLPEYRALGLAELYGLRVDADENGGRILFRLSVDGGATWLFHDGTRWTAASAADWNTVDEVDREVPSFPIADRRVLFRVRLEPSPDGKATPVVRLLALYLEYEVDFWEDLARSLKHQIERALAVRCVWRGKANGTLVTMDTEFDVRPPVRVYDLGVERNRSVDIFATRDGKLVRLTRTATGPVEVRFSGKAPVHIATNVDFQVSEIPSIVLQFPTITELRRLRNGDRKLDWALARRRVRERLQPIVLAADVVCVCQSSRKRDTLAMADALAQLFEYERAVLSEATGEALTVTTFGPVNVQDAIGRGLFAAQVPLTVSGPAWLGEAQEKRLVEQDVGLSIRGIDRKFNEEG